ncbi:MAG: class I SAM-dependent methyltransferase, partial [Thermodesulfobacteriota bacterium]
GDLSRLAVKALGGQGRVMVCDFTLSMLEVGRRKRAEPAAGRIDWIQGDAESLPLRDQSVDALMIGFGIRNLTTPRQGVREMHRVLKPGGRVLCLEFSKPVNPVFCRLYDVYSLTVMPLMARLIAGSGLPYTRLAETIRLFPAAEGLGRLFQEEGFRRLACLNLTNGIAASQLLQKR